MKKKENKKINFRVGDYPWVNGPFGTKDNGDEVALDFTGFGVIVETAKFLDLPELTNENREKNSDNAKMFRVMLLCEALLDGRGSMRHSRGCLNCRSIRRAQFPLWFREESLSI